MAETRQTGAPAGPATPAAPEDTIGGLVHRLSEQIPELVRSEIRLAQAELTQKGKNAGIGIGSFGAAGLLAFFGLATLIATAVLALANAVPAWLAALIVAVLLLAAAAAAALLGKKKVQEATPPTPERAVAGLKQDVATVKGGHQ